MKRWQRAIAGVGLLAVLAAGCGPPGTPTYPVSGTVTWNGKPVEKGYINFEPVEENETPNGGKIINGEFSFEATAGEKRVKIHADRQITEKDPVMGIAERRPYIPAKFNSETTLREEITSDGENQFDFDLTGEEIVPSVD